MDWNNDDDDDDDAKNMLSRLLLPAWLGMQPSSAPKKSHRYIDAEGHFHVQLFKMVWTLERSVTGEPRGEYPME